VFLQLQSVSVLKLHLNTCCFIAHTRQPTGLILKCAKDNIYTFHHSLECFRHRLSLKLSCGESRGHKPYGHVEMFAIKSVTSLQQTRVALVKFRPLRYTGKVGNKVCGPRTQILKVRNTNCESRCHDLCRRLSWSVSATFHAGKFRWKSQSRRNGIWA